MEISLELLVREYVWIFYLKNVVVIIKFILVGIDVIDVFYQFEGVKWISDKLISVFDDEQWFFI